MASFQGVTSLPEDLNYVCISPSPAGLAFCIFSLLCGVLLGLFDWRAERILKRKDNRTPEKISIWDVKDFPLRLWLVFIICVAYYVTVFPFIGLATLVTRCLTSGCSAGP